MASLAVGAKSFARRYEQKTTDLMQLAGKFPRDFSPDAVHDLRVATRRVQTLCRLLPKGTRRTERYAKFNTALGSLLKSSSRVRDLDTLALTLERTKASLPPELFNALNNDRVNALRLAKPAVERISGAIPPAVDSAQFDRKKLSRWLRRRIDKRRKVATGLLDKVLSDETRIEDLHAMRKEVKKLRYLFELTDKNRQELPLLARWQDALGEIHDLDVAMAYLREDRWDFAKERALVELGRRRHLCYRQFIRRYKKHPVVTLGN